MGGPRHVPRLEGVASGLEHGVGSASVSCSSCRLAVPTRTLASYVLTPRATLLLVRWTLLVQRLSKDFLFNLCCISIEIRTSFLSQQMYKEISFTVLRELSEALIYGISQLCTSSFLKKNP
jgi:hypothetical protein